MLRIVCLFIASLITVAVHAAPITITSARFLINASDGVDLVTEIDEGAGFGFRSLLGVDGASSSVTDFNIVDTGSGALLDLDMGHVRGGALNSIARTVVSTVGFTADAASSYSVSGLYSADNVSGIGRVFSQVSLRNLTTDTVLFTDYEESENTSDVDFIVGVGGEGDASSLLLGSATGFLVAGNEYEFVINNFIYADPIADGGASATGCVTLSIGGATGAGSCGISVPEPMPLTLLSFGLLALGLRRKVLRSSV